MAEVDCITKLLEIFCIFCGNQVLKTFCLATLTILLNAGDSLKNAFGKNRLSDVIMAIELRSFLNDIYIIYYTKETNSLNQKVAFW